MRGFGFGAWRDSNFWDSEVLSLKADPGLFLVCRLYVGRTHDWDELTTPWVDFPMLCCPLYSGVGVAEPPEVNQRQVVFLAFGVQNQQELCFALYSNGRHLDSCARMVEAGLVRMISEVGFHFLFFSP